MINSRQLISLGQLGHHGIGENMFLHTGRPISEPINPVGAVLSLHEIVDGGDLVLSQPNFDWAQALLTQMLSAFFSMGFRPSDFWPFFGHEAHQ